MAHLADVTREVRIALKLLTASLIVVVFLFIFFKGGSIMKNLFFPTPPPPPEEKFGKLPRISFPAQKIGNIKYKINTLSGDLPGLTDRINVYKVKRKTPSIIALQTVRENLKSQGFSENEVKINDSLYQWNSNNQVVIQYNIFNDYFKITSNFLVNPPPPPKEGTKKDRVFSVTTDFLQGLGFETSDFTQEESNIDYLKITNGTLTMAENQNDAQFVRIDLFQKNIDKDYKIYYPSAKNSTTYFIFKNDSSPSKIVAGKYQHLIPDNSSSYPIITAESAFEELKKGNALVFNDNAKTKDIIDITDISLGYYAGEENQQYFLPIIVFKGNGFKAYVQAIPETSIGN